MSNNYSNTIIPSGSGSWITSSKYDSSELDTSSGLSVDGDSVFRGETVFAGDVTLIDKHGNKTSLNPHMLTVNVRLMAAVKVMDENSGTSLKDAILHKDFYFYSEKARDYIRLKEAITNDAKKMDEKFLVLEAMFDMPDEILDLI
jgi:hypothetical protein